MEMIIDTYSNISPLNVMFRFLETMGVKELLVHIFSTPLVTFFKTTNVITLFFTGFPSADFPSGGSDFQYRCLKK